MSTVSVVACESYEPHAVRQALSGLLAPLGGMVRFVRPGMTVLLKPNLLAAAAPETAVDTHPALVRAVADLVTELGGQVQIGDSPGGPVEVASQVWRESGLADLATQADLRLVPFDSASWRPLNGTGYFIAKPVLEADLVINLPKLKTHALVLYTGAIKNLFGVIPGTRKRELHVRAPGIADFSRVLVDMLELTRPGLTIMDGVLGLEGNGPGTGGQPHAFKCMAASTDPVALDAVLAQALGYRPGHVRHIEQASARELGVAALDRIQVVGEPRAVDFGKVRLPAAHWYFNVPAGITRPLDGLLKAKPRFDSEACAGCGRCAQVCPKKALTVGRPPSVDLGECIGCLCCAEVCPHAAVEPRRSLLARLAGLQR